MFRFLAAALLAACLAVPGAASALDRVSDLRIDVVGFVLTGDRALISWSRPSGREAGRHSIHRQRNGAWTNLGTVRGSTRTFTASGHRQGDDYYVTAYATGQGRVEDFRPPANQLPSQPVAHDVTDLGISLRGTRITSSLVRLSWSLALDHDASEFVIYRRIYTTPWRKHATVSGDRRSYHFDNHGNGVSYLVQARSAGYSYRARF